MLAPPPGPAPLRPGGTGEPPDVSGVALALSLGMVHVKSGYPPQSWPQNEVNVLID